MKLFVKGLIDEPTLDAIASDLAQQEAEVNLLIQRHQHTGSARPTMAIDQLLDAKIYPTLPADWPDLEVFYKERILGWRRTKRSG